jgi:hypothetical protein
MWESKHAYRGSLRKTAGKRKLGRPRLRWEGNIKLCL